MIANIVLNLLIDVTSSYVLFCKTIRYYILKETYPRPLFSKCLTSFEWTGFNFCPVKENVMKILYRINFKVSVE